MSLALTVFLVAWLIGLVGTFIPVMPATLIIFLGSVAATWLDGFDPLDWWWLAGLAIITLGISLIDNFTSGWGARRYGGSRQAMWGAIIGGLIGIFLPFGLIIGPLGGALVAELLVVRRPVDQALRSAWGTLVGLLTGIAAKFVAHVLIGVAEIWRLVAW